MQVASHSHTLPPLILSEGAWSGEATMLLLEKKKQRKKNEATQERSCFLLLEQGQGQRKDKNTTKE